MDHGTFDMHGYPVYNDVVKVQDDLQEEQLRNTHPELKQAYEEYQKLLEKYKFWDKFESKQVDTYTIRVTLVMQVQIRRVR